MNERVTILYVDDEPINLMLFEANFKRGFHVITALSGAEGLIKLNVHPEIKVVVSDMKMPGMDGLEFIKTAKVDFSNLAYFILTGYDVTEEISLALTSNLISKYFRKPFKMQEIELAISTALDRTS